MRKILSNKLLCLLVLILNLPLFASIEKYFKAAPDKSQINPIKGVDFIYMINLDQRPEKFAAAANELNAYGIHPYRFSAVNGWELSYEAINNVGVSFQEGMTEGMWGTFYDKELVQPNHEIMHRVGQTYFSHCMSRGAIGIALSHLSILQDAYDSGYETIWVMEDDVEVIKDPMIISELIAKLDRYFRRENWDILFTDQDTKNQKGEYVPCLGYALKPNCQPSDPRVFQIRKNYREFRKIGARYGAYSMIVNRSGMKKILDFIKTYKIFLPYDMEFYLPSGINMYTVRDDIVSTKINALSDNGGANYNNKKQD